MPATLRHPASLTTIQYLLRNPTQLTQLQSSNTLWCASAFCPDQGGLGPTERAPEQSFCFKTLAALHLPRPPLWPDGVGGQLTAPLPPQDGQEYEGPFGPWARLGPPTPREMPG
ncbi:hypothetical protein CABS03_10311 [Colletotrichum abscissum]|uniref:Uncharacterized protein n=1 Tax=Colletotrichum abscissum TaxID=1671311 RepID=A0A9P9X233_9PEZI|nr:hypothetical protein CABS02_13926 [Colletotrichum abscissum]